MKKIILLFSVTWTIFLSSCSGSDDENTSTTDILLKKTIETYESGGNMITYTRDFTYNGNKLVNVVGIEGNDREEERYTYTGDLITKMESLTGSVVEDTEIYEYNANNQLIKVTATEAGYPSVFRSVYVYNANGTVSVTNYTGTATDQGQQTSTSTISFINGDVSRVERTSTGSASTRIYRYDDKNNPFKNITGLNKIIFALGDEPGIVHNMVERINEEQSFPQNNSTTTIQYTYNSDNYPVTSSESRLRNGTTTNRGTTQYFY